MMRPSLVRTLSLALVGSVCLLVGAKESAAPLTKKADKEKATFAAIGDLDAEIAVLTVLHGLQPTTGQKKALLAVAGKTMQEPPPRKLISVSARFLKALKAHRDALAEGDIDTIEKSQTALEKLRKTEDTESDEIEITDEARKQAPALLKRFSARQIAVYVGGLDDFPDPFERLTRTMEEAGAIDKKAWPTQRDDVAYQVGWLVAGMDTKAEEKVRDKATELLNKAARIDKREYEQKREALEKEARALIGDLGPTDVIRHFMQRVVAETLSNHRFEAALKLRAK